MAGLRDDIIKLAQAQPTVRQHVVPILERHADDVHEFAKHIPPRPPIPHIIRPPGVDALIKTDPHYATKTKKADADDKSSERATEMAIAGNWHSNNMEFAIQSGHETARVLHASAKDDHGMCEKQAGWSGHSELEPYHAAMMKYHESMVHFHMKAHQMLGEYYHKMHAKHASGVNPADHKLFVDLAKKFHVPVWMAEEILDQLFNGGRFWHNFLTDVSVDEMKNAATVRVSPTDSQMNGLLQALHDFKRAKGKA